MVPLARFWDRYSRVAAGVLAALIAAGAIGYFVIRSRRAAEEAAAGKLAESVIRYFQYGDYRGSLQVARETSAQYGSTPSGREAHRQAGDAAYADGDFKTAVAEYRRYMATRPPGLLADAARRSYAYALESDKQPLEAVKEYDALVGRFDRGSSAEFLIAAARCLVAAHQTPAAVERLRRLVNEFGETEYANQALVEIAELEAAGPGKQNP